jgi:hypothetical protein
MDRERWQEMWEHTFHSWDAMRADLKILEDKDRAIVRLMTSPTWATLPDDLRADYIAFHDELVVALHQVEVRLTDWEARLRAFGERLGLNPDADESEDHG